VCRKKARRSRTRFSLPGKKQSAIFRIPSVRSFGESKWNNKNPADAGFLLCSGTHAGKQTEDAGQEDAKPSETEPEKSGTGKEKTADAGEKTYKVFIETGHGIDENGKWDPGCSWSDGTETYEEARIMIPVAAAMTKYLRQSGVEVYTDAETDNGQNLMATLDFLETHKVDAFVNLHCDWENSGSGTMPLYRTEEQKQLAVCLNEGVHSVIDIPDRGLAYREDLDTLNSDKPGCPACLFETGSIDDDFEILTEHYDEYGKGLAKGMCSFLGVDFVEE
jgi:N-acetylmuramoyl-L-alanine amidase